MCKKKNDLFIEFCGKTYRLEEVDNKAALQVIETQSKGKKQQMSSIKIPVGYDEVLDTFAKTMNLSIKKYIDLALSRRVKGLSPLCRIPEPQGGMWEADRESYPVRIPTPLYKEVKIDAATEGINISEYICGAIFGWYEGDDE